MYYFLFYSICKLVIVNEHCFILLKFKSKYYDIFELDFYVYLECFFKKMCTLNVKNI